MRGDNEEAIEERPDETTEDSEFIPTPTTSEITEDPQSPPHEVEPFILLLFLSKNRHR